MPGGGWSLGSHEASVRSGWWPQGQRAPYGSLSPHDVQSRQRGEPYRQTASAGLKDVKDGFTLM